MASPRRFSNNSIEELERISTFSSGDVGVLGDIVTELKKRKTKRAAILLATVEKALSKHPRAEQSSKSESVRPKPVLPIKKPRVESANPPTLPPKSPPTVPPLLSTTDTDEGKQSPLPPHLQEFVQALHEEIDAAKKNIGGNAALLSEGRLIAPVGSGFHYRFQSQRPLRVPPDTPGFLAVSGHMDDIQVSVVEIEDLSVVLELPKQIGSIVPQAKLKTDLTMLLLRLIDRIETKGPNSHPSADRILGFATASLAVQNFDAFNQKLNDEQRLAVGSVLGGDTVFIWGPPGTGKTQTIGEIGAQLFTRRKTLLIVSHTNTAVDEALLRIAVALDGKFNEGEVLRLGEPVKTELQARPHLILKRVAEKRSIELEQQKKEAERAKIRASTQLETVNRKVEICQWLAQSDNDCAIFTDRHSAINSAEGELKSLEETLIQAASRKEQWIGLRAKAVNALKEFGALIHIKERAVASQSELMEARRAEEFSKGELSRLENQLKLARQAEPYRLRLDSLPRLERAQADVASAKKHSDQAKNIFLGRVAEQTVAETTLKQTLSVGAIKRMWLKLPAPEVQQQVVVRLTAGVEASRAVLGAADMEAKSTEEVLAEVKEVMSALERFPTVPRLTKAESEFREGISRSEIAANDEMACRDRMRILEREHERLFASVATFTDEAGGSPEDALSSAEANLESLSGLEDQVAGLERKVNSDKRQLSSDLAELVAALAFWNLCDGGGDNEDDFMRSLATARIAAKDQVGSDDLPTLVTERNQLSAMVAELIEEIRSIEEAIRKVEAELLANVRILATTLTRSFMRDGIQQRSFDTVLVDEASMAPIPALWAASTLAERCVVAVGDFKQLPPIVQSEHPVAKRWLGRDVFAASGIQGAWERETHPPYFVALREQHRMHPDISAIVNALVYEGLLRNGSSVTDSKSDAAIKSWHTSNSDALERVKIVDMGSANAWNTTADRSRFNLLSAMTSVEMIHRWLGTHRSKLNEGEAKRILVICPYRPQAKLLDVMVREDGLEIEVSANTAHSFQGSEADAILIDLVVDEPHYNANLLTPAASADIARLLNVAITRAKRKVCILADLNWFRTKGKGAFVGGKLIPWLSERYPVVDATSVFGIIESVPAEHGVMSPRETQTLLFRTVAQALRQVVIFSPSLDVKTARELAALRDFRTFPCFIVTQTPDEQRGRMRHHLDAEDVLRDGGIRIIHKRKMLDKLAIVDGESVWSASFPMLLLAPTNGYGIRRISRKFAVEVKDFYFLDKLIEPYAEGPHSCPICAKEMVASDARKEKPFYWHCIDDGCYIRDLDSPAPVDGLIISRCGSVPEFGYWGEVANWLCTCGQKPSHRMKIHRNHLRLPKMRALVPSRSWNKVCRELGVDPDSRIQGTLLL